MRDRTARRNRLAAPGAHAIATRLHRILATFDAEIAGLAPHPRQSGKTDAYRRTLQPALRCFYQRIIANGKKPLVALTATIRTLITIANLQIREQRQTQLSR